MPRQLDCDAIIPFLSSRMCVHFTFNTPAVAHNMGGMLAKILLRCRKCWVCQHFYNCFPSNSAVSVPSAPFYSCFSLAYLPSFPSVNSYDQKHAHRTFRCFVTLDGYRFSNSEPSRLYDITLWMCVLEEPEGDWNLLWYILLKLDYVSDRFAFLSHFAQREARDFSLRRWSKEVSLTNSIPFSYIMWDIILIVSLCAVVHKYSHSRIDSFMHIWGFCAVCCRVQRLHSRSYTATLWKTRARIVRWKTKESG